MFKQRPLSEGDKSCQINTSNIFSLYLIFDHATLELIEIGKAMSILRITIRTFQNEEHADLFLEISKNTPKLLDKHGLKVKFTVAQKRKQKNQVVSVWEYEDEKHMQDVRKTISAMSKFPNALNPKEVVYESNVIHSFDSY